MKYLSRDHVLSKLKARLYVQSIVFFFFAPSVSAVISRSFKTFNRELKIYDAAFKMLKKQCNFKILKEVTVN